MWILWLIGTQIGVPVGFLHRVDNNVFQVIITHSFVGKRRIKNGKVYLVLTIICYSKFRKTSDKIYKNRAWKIRLSKPMYIKKALLTTTYFGVVWTSIDLGQIGQFTSVFRWFWYQYYRASYRNIFRFIYRSDDILSEKFIKLMRQNFLCYEYIRDWQKKISSIKLFSKEKLDRNLLSLRDTTLSSDWSDAVILAHSTWLIPGQLGGRKCIIDEFEMSHNWSHLNKHWLNTRIHYLNRNSKVSVNWDYWFNKLLTLTQEHIMHRTNTW